MKVALPLLMGLALLGAACSGDKNTEKLSAKAPVRTAAVERANLAQTLQAVGNVRASASVGLIPRVTGQILAVNFKEGQEVREGEPLVQIDPAPYAAALKEKQGLLAKSEAQLIKANDDRKRFGKLVHNGYVSQEAFQQTATDAAVLRATVEADRAAAENAALELAYCTLKAPISGRIGPLNMDRGQMVKANDATPIASIDTIAPCYVVFSLPEVHLAAILRRMERGPVQIMAKPTGGEAESGQLTLVDNSVDTKTGTIRLRGVFQNAARKLWPGQFVEVSMPLGEVENTLVIPSRAIQAGREEAFVYIIDENGKAQYKKVKVIFENNGLSAVSGDLAAGDKVVVEGQVRLAPGMEVRVVD